MDQIELLDEQVDEGQRLIDYLIVSGFDVEAAAWVKPTEEERWLLYVVSGEVDSKGLAAAYSATSPVLKLLRDPWAGLSELKLVSPMNPIAKDIVDLARHFPGRMAARSRRPRLGGMAVDEIYVYTLPPPEEKWRGISVMVYPEVDGTFRVEFWPHYLQAEIGPGGQPRRVPRPASVRIDQGKVVEYRPPEKPIPYLDKRDYEEKALPAVQEVGRKSA